MHEISPTVIGAGAWGTAFANYLAGLGYSVKIWAREPEVVRQIETGENETFLPGINLRKNIFPANDFKKALKDSNQLYFAVPVQYIRETIKKIPIPLFPEEYCAINLSKGIEISTRKLPHQILYECLPNNPDIFSLSGPSFAHEVASRKPVLLVIGGDLQKSKVIQEKLSSESLRIYQSKDIIGVELSAALKNVFAIAAGILDGLNTGQNGRAALIVRGLAELRRFIIAMGGDSTTVFGIAGLGDLVLTCTGSNSRNHRLGTMIAQGKSAEEILSSVKWVAEGYFTAPAALVMANKMGVSLPITEQVVQAINNEIRPQEAINLLMTRPLKKEFPI